MRKIHLVGTDHRYQRGFALGVSDDVFAEFREMLQIAIARHTIRGIAEEMSLDGLSRWYDTGGSIGFHLAAELKLTHRYCDPDQATRKAMSMTSPQERERYWLDQLLTFDGFPALFILGSTHVGRFERLLADAGFEVLVEAHDWEPSSKPVPVT